jgi:hypothetical protein
LKAASVDADRGVALAAAKALKGLQRLAAAPATKGAGKK